jgi:hypothetical protein
MKPWSTWDADLKAIGRMILVYLIALPLAFLPCPWDLLAIIPEAVVVILFWKWCRSLL